MQRGNVAAAERNRLSPKAERRRRVILDAAAQAFMQKGFAPTSIDDVADVLGATKGQIYYYYRSKTDLFFDVHLAAMEMDMAAIKDAQQAHEDPLARLRAMSEAHLNVIVENFPYQRVAVQSVEMHMEGQTTEEQRDRIRHLLKLRDEYEALFAGEISGAMTSGAIPQQNVKLVVKAFLGALNWTTFWFRPEHSKSAKENAVLVATITQFAMQGLGGTA
ncbi:MAG: TetR family transcriptional regulator [Roseovarius sp.]